VSRIVIASESAEFVDRVQQAMDFSCVALPLGPLPLDPAGLFAQLSDGLPPEVVVLDSSADIEQALDLASRFDQQCPRISVVLVTELYLEIGLEAMRVGVRDMLHPDMEGLDISLVLRRAADAAQSRAVEVEATAGVSTAGPAGDVVPVGRVITVASAKGGAGKTLIATNLAVGLARAAVHSTVLVDLDLQFGDVASGLNLEPEYSLPDALRGPASRDTMVLKTFLTLHETGLYVICGPTSPGAADLITGVEVSQLLQLLATEFDFVVVDTSSGLSDHVLAALDQTSDLVLVTSMDVPGVRGMRKELDALTELAMFPESRHLVLNFVDRRGGLSIDDVEATLGTAVDVTLPRCTAALESVNAGIPLLQGSGRDPLTAGLTELVDRFRPAPEPVGRRWSRRRHQADDATAAVGGAGTPRRSRQPHAAVATQEAR
jgi:pilus assembly protein CpaE